MRTSYLITALCLVAVLATSASALQAPYSFTASLDASTTLTGQVSVETTDPGFAPGGTVQFSTGGITAFYFSATNGITTEVIDSSLFTPTPQTMKLTFSATSFPQVESWDFSFSNEFYGGVLIQAITVYSPTNPGYDSWSGVLLAAHDSPSSGVWTAPEVVPNDATSWGNLKSLYR